MPTKHIEIDHDVKWIRLCWRDKVGGKWQMGEYFKMTDNYAANLVKYMNEKYPEYKHWAEAKE